MGNSFGMGFDDIRFGAQSEKSLSTSEGLVELAAVIRAGLSLLWAWGYLIIRGIFFILLFEEKSNHN